MRKRNSNSITQLIPLKTLQALIRECEEREARNSIVVYIPYTSGHKPQNPKAMLLRRAGGKIERAEFKGRVVACATVSPSKLRAELLHYRSTRKRNRKLAWG